MGEEEALCQINAFLHNNRWWVKADNLNIRELGFAIEGTEDELSKSDEAIVNFIWENKDLVHDNTLRQIDVKNNDSIRMALNQIHYASIKASNEKTREGVTSATVPARIIVPDSLLGIYVH